MIQHLYHWILEGKDKKSGAESILKNKGWAFFTVAKDIDLQIEEAEKMKTWKTTLQIPPRDTL